MLSRWAGGGSPYDDSIADHEPALAPGKLPNRLLARLLSGIPAPGPDVLLGPAVGEDACVIDVPAGALVAATDPITLTTRDVGRSAVIINANDVAVSGVRPRWFLAVVLLPPGATAGEAQGIFSTLRDGLEEVGASLVGGHTEVTEAVTQPVVVGQMMGTGEGFLSTSGAGPGDVLVQVGPTPVEGAAVLAAEAAALLQGLPSGMLEAASRGLEDPGISVVEPALEAARLGATAMHDPTEGGLASGLHEMAVAASVAVTVDMEAVLWFPPGVAVCQELGADPWGTLGSGTLLAAFPPDRWEQAVHELRSGGYRAARIGTVEEGAGVRDRAGGFVPWPTRDEVARVLSGPT
ncbi:MAG: AIR synthase-related protein, partial [Actinomycetota bacterium]